MGGGQVMSDPQANDGRLMQRVRFYWDLPVRRFIWDSLLRVPWLIAFNVGGTAVLVILFAGTSQGQDLLRISAERGFSLGNLNFLWNLLFLISTLIGSLSLWYASRLVLGVKYPGYPLDPKYSAFGRRWWPRVLGSVVPLAIGWTFLQIGSQAPSSETLLGWLYLAMGIALLLFYLVRRPMFRVSKDDMILHLHEEVPTEHRNRGRSLLIGAFALVPLFVLAPVLLPQILGAPAIAVLGVVGISLFGTAILTYLPMSNGAPPLTLAVLLLALVSGIWNDNHAVRVTDGRDGTAQRPTPVEQLTAWQQGRPSGVTAPDRVVLVATSGGGISAAYWTASTLAYLEQKFGAPFAERLFAVSGVSGGSLGAATYVTLKRAGLKTGQPDGLLDQVREVLGHDFLSPVIAGMLFPDLVQRFLPVPIGLADRQRFLERSWESAFDGEARALFKGPFQGLYSGPEAVALPSLLLNTTIVETGQRGVFSNLSVDGLPQVIDLLEPRYGLSGIRTSAAAGASARFTYVSPAGTVQIEGGGKLRLVDGGYFENSGAASMTDLIARLVKDGAAIRPILIIIDNDTTAPNLCQRDGSVDQPPSGDGFNSSVSEVTAPAKALLQTRAARGELAEVNAADLVEGIGGTVVEVPLASVLRARLAALGAADAETIAEVESRYVEPPLGWSLSQEVREGMDNTLRNEQGGLDRQIHYLAIALGLEEGEVPPCAAR
jgi:hypothetical protein